jgi:hypothetical protein
MAHPNEPVGALTVLKLAELLADDPELVRRLGLRFVFLPCVDPDGARLNERWFAGPLDHHTYARNVYRPPFHRQVEWTFPRPGGPPPLSETQMLMALIDRFEPRLMVSLHSSEHGGFFSYLSVRDDALSRRLAALEAVSGLRGHILDPESLQSERLADGVFLSLGDPRLHLPASNGSGPNGASSEDYARRHGTVSLMPEVAMWRDDRIADRSMVGDERVTALRSEQAASCSMLLELFEAARGGFTRSTPFHEVVEETPTQFAQLEAYWSDLCERLPQTGLTMAEFATLESHFHVTRLRACGHLTRVLECESDHGRNPRMGRYYGSSGRMLRRWSAEADFALGLRMSVESAVKTQIAAVLAAAHEMGKQRIGSDSPAPG